MNRTLRSRETERHTDSRTGDHILGTFIDAVSMEDVIGRITHWAQKRESRSVCICNVHSIVTAERDDAFGRALNSADLATPDGAPIAWALRRSGFPGQKRVCGPDITWEYLHIAERRGHTVFFYGSTDAILAKLKRVLVRSFPGLKIGGMVSPPFRALSDAEDAAYVRQMNASGANVVFVGLGCPKQELWTAAHRGRVNAVMVGVGAAFEFHAGTIRRAPQWMGRIGLEWFYRLVSEPRRLWERYLVTNTLFVLGMLRERFIPIQH